MTMMMIMGKMHRDTLCCLRHELSSRAADVLVCSTSTVAPSVSATLTRSACHQVSGVRTLDLVTNCRAR